MVKTDLKKLKIHCFCKHPDPRVLIKGKKFNIVKCKNCKLIYADTSLSPKDINALYDIDNSELKIRESPIEKDDCIRRLKIIRKFFPKSLKNKQIRILDFGTGLSNFIYLAKKQGYDVYGQDIDQKIMQFHKRKKMKMADINKIKDNYFDVITLFHVFEHIDEPLELLELLKKKLKKNGIIYIDVPNGESLEIKLFGEGSPYVSTSDKSHLYYYSLKTLSRILKDSGFKIVRKKHKGVFAIGLISGFKNKVTGSHNVESTYQKGKLLANIYRKTCELLRISDCIEVIGRK